MDDPRPEPVEATIDEATLRLPAWSRHSSVTLANGQGWAIPVLTDLEFMLFIDGLVLKRNGRQIEEVEATDLEPDPWRRCFERVMAFSRFNMAVGPRLLALNYRLTESQVIELFCPDDFGLIVAINGGLMAYLAGRTERYEAPIGWHGHDGILFEN